MLNGESRSSITVRNLPEETHRALRVRAAMAGRSTEAEVRAFLKSVARPECRIKLGSLLAEIVHQAANVGSERRAPVQSRAAHPDVLSWLNTAL